MVGAVTIELKPRLARVKGQRNACPWGSAEENGVF